MPFTLRHLRAMNGSSTDQAAAIIGSALSHALRSADLTPEKQTLIVDEIVMSLIHGSYHTLAFYLHRNRCTALPDADPVFRYGPLTPSWLKLMEETVHKQERLTHQEQNRICGKLPL